MARIPTVEALGEANVQATRGVTNYAPAVQGFGAEREEAAALGGIGKQIGHIGAEFEKKVNEEELYRQQARLSMFDLDQERRLDEEKRNMAPGGEGFAANYKNQYDAAARGFMADVPEQHKARVDAMLAKRADHWVQQANRSELAERDRFHLEAVDKDVRTLIDDTTAAPERGQANIERGLPIIDSSKLAPRAKAVLRQKFLEQNDEAAMRGMLDKAETLDDMIRLRDEFKKTPKGSLLRGSDAEGSGAIKRDGNMAVVSSGSGANFRVATPHAEQFAGLVKDLEAEGIVIKPEESGGYNPRNIAGTNIRSKHADGLAVDVNWGENPKGGKSAIVEAIGADRIREIAAKNGLKWGGDFRSNPDPMHFEVDPGGVERKPLSERGLTRYAGMKSPRTTDAVDDNDPGTVPSSDAPVTDSAGLEHPDDALTEVDDAKFRHLRPEKRRTMLNLLRTAMSNKVQHTLQDDIERIKRTGDPVRDADGKTSLDKAQKLLLPNQFEKYKSAWDEAVLERSAIAPLANMTSDEAANHVASFAPSDDDNSNDRYKTRSKVYEKAKAALEKIEELRSKDFAVAVEQTPEVQEARARIKALRASKTTSDPDTPGEYGPTTPHRVTGPLEKIAPMEKERILIEARIQAQRRLLGLSDNDKSQDWKITPITKQESLKVLNMDPTKLTADELEKGLKVAADKVNRSVPPQYANDVFRSVLGFYMRSKEEREVAKGLVKRYMSNETLNARAEAVARSVRGENLTIEDTRRIRDLEQIDQQSAPDYGPPVNRMQFTPPETPLQFPKPNEKHKKYLQDNPDSWNDYERKFGRGTAAEALGKQK